MIIKKSIVLLVALLFSCGIFRTDSEESYSLILNFMGKDFEEKSVSIKIDDTLLFSNIQLGKMPYSINIYEVAIGYRNGYFELYKRRNGGVLKQKPFNLNLKHIKVVVEVDQVKTDYTINVNNGKYYHIKLENKKIKFIQLKSNRLD